MPKKLENRHILVRISGKNTTTYALKRKKYKFVPQNCVFIRENWPVLICMRYTSTGAAREIIVHRSGVMLFMEEGGTSCTLGYCIYSKSDYIVDLVIITSCSLIALKFFSCSETPDRSCDMCYSMFETKRDD